LRTLAALVAALSVASAEAAASEWLAGTVLADCTYCSSAEFKAERRAIANQTGTQLDPAAATGYVVTLDGGGRFVWGRAALVGTGNLIRTDAHVLFADTGVFKARDGKIYFEPAHHGEPSDLIEIDRASVQRGNAVGPLEADVKHDWAIAHLREDAIAKFDGERVFAFLWDVRVTHADIVKPDVVRAASLVLGGGEVYPIERCDSAVDDQPSRFAFDADEVLFTRCAAEGLLAGASGSALAIRAHDGSWHLAGQLVAGGTDARTRAAAGTEPASSGPFQPQLFLGNVPGFRETMAAVYLKELVRRGRDPRNR
jgi:hypothetical protein